MKHLVLTQFGTPSEPKRGGKVLCAFDERQ
jgi:hypothetical protein